MTIDLDPEVEELRKLEASLAEIRSLKDAIAATNKRLEELETPVRKWLEAHDGERIEDPEHGIAAWYEEARAPNGGGIDLVALRDHDPATMARLLDLGILQANMRLLAEQTKAGQIAVSSRYMIPAGTVKRLQVKSLR